MHKVVRGFMLYKSDIKANSPQYPFTFKTVSQAVLSLLKLF